jgi:hypothetical protein
MPTLEQLEQQIAQLSEPELAQFRAWFAGFDATAWDEQIQRDVEAGKLNSLAQQALAAHRKGQTRPL